MNLRKSCAALRDAFSTASLLKIDPALLKKSLAAAFNRASVSAAAALAGTRRFAQRAMKISLRTSLIAASLASAGLSVKATVDIWPYSKSQNMKLLNECNYALREGKTCSPAAAAEKQRSREGLKDLGVFILGGAGFIGFGYAAFPMTDNKKKTKPKSGPKK